MNTLKSPIIKRNISTLILIVFFSFFNLSASDRIYSQEQKIKRIKEKMLIQKMHIAAIGLVCKEQALQSIKDKINLFFSVRNARFFEPRERAVIDKTYGVYIYAQLLVSSIANDDEFHQLKQQLKNEEKIRLEKLKKLNTDLSTAHELLANDRANELVMLNILSTIRFNGF